MTGSSGSLGGKEGWILHASLYTLYAHSTTAGPVRAFADSRAEVPKKKENSTPACTGLHQEGWWPERISVEDSCLEFGPVDSQIILRPGSAMCPRFPLLPSEPDGEPWSAVPGGGRPSPSFALSRPSIEMLRWQDAKLQDLRPALCLPWRPAEGKCHLQAEDGPLGSGRHHPGLSGTGCALPVQVESSLYK